MSPAKLRQLQERFGNIFLQVYGATECLQPVTTLYKRDHVDLDAKRLTSAGRVAITAEVRVMDEEGRPVSCGETGEVWLRSRATISGYYKNPEATAAAFFPDGWLRTGDLGHFDDEGFLWIDGRQGGFIKVRGRRVALAEIEERVAAVSGVSECAAVGVPHAEAGEAIALFVVNAGDPAGLEARVRGALPTAWDCAFVRLVPELPHTSSGKVSRVGVNRMVAELQTANERAG